MKKQNLVSGTFDSAKRANKSHEQSWTVAILPYIEEVGIKNLYDYKKAWFNNTVNSSGSSNLKVISQSVAVYRCPSTETGRVDEGFTTPDKPAAGDYGSLNGMKTDFTKTPFVSGADENSAPFIGVLNKQADSSDKPMAQCRIKNVSDGTSKTIMIAECAGRPSIYVFGKKTGNSVTEGTGWADPDNGISVKGSTSAGVTPGTIMINATNEGEPSSFHVGGAEFCFADGSTHFINDTITAVAFQALVTRSGGEPSPEY